MAQAWERAHQFFLALVQIGVLSLGAYSLAVLASDKYFYSNHVDNWWIYTMVVVSSLSLVSLLALVLVLFAKKTGTWQRELASQLLHTHGMSIALSAVVFVMSYRLKDDYDHLDMQSVKHVAGFYANWTVVNALCVVMAVVSVPKFVSTLNFIWEQNATYQRAPVTDER